jgi:uncharacterized protein YerC
MTDQTALQEALASLLGEKRTGSRLKDLILAAREALARRVRNSEDGAAVIAALIDEGLSYRQIEAATGIPRATAQRWAAPPERKKIHLDDILSELDAD